MPGSLVPQMRTDKNGRVQKRWVRPGTPPSGAPKLPPPDLTPGAAVDAAPSPAPALTEQQTERRTQYPAFVNDYTYDEHLMAELGVQEFPTYLRYSDAELYDLIAVVQPEAAVLFLQRDADRDGGERSTTGEEAVEFLIENGFDEFIVERGELTAEALSRGISTYETLGLLGAVGPRVMDRDHHRFLDAALVKGSKEFEYRAEYWRAVLDGSVSLEDIQTVGFERVGPISATLLPWFMEIRRSDWLDAAMLAHAVDGLQGREAYLAEAIGIVRDHGREYFTGLKSVRDAAVVSRHYSKEPPARRRALIDYAAVVSRPRFVLDDLAVLLDSGLDANEASQMLDNGMTAEQAADAHRKGINRNVASGWL